MPASRPPPPNPTPRRSTSPSTHPQIDTSLKAARFFAQRLAPLDQCLQDEMRVLERVYYKSVNQHRVALFWRRVQEVRRLGKRVLEVRLSTLLDEFRYSFYVNEKEGEERNPKILRGAWSQAPNAKFLTFMYERTRDVLELVNTAKERFTIAFHSLSLMMQTGAFLQLILVLTAIVSRLNTIMEELSTLLQSFSTALSSLLEALGHKKSKAKLTNQPDSIQRKPLLKEQDYIMHETLDEDLGSTVLRGTAVGCAVSSDHQGNITEFWQSDEQPMNEALLEPPSIIITSAATAAAKDVPQIKTSNLLDIAKYKKKKKKRKDEIDDIFGSLA